MAKVIKCHVMAKNNIKCTFYMQSTDKNRQIVSLLARKGLHTEPNMHGDTQFQIYFLKTDLFDPLTYFL